MNLIKTNLLKKPQINLKKIFKLMNNSVFGKTMENIRQRVDIRLVNNEKVAKKFSAKPNFKHCTILDENFIAIHKK